MWREVALFHAVVYGKNLSAPCNVRTENYIGILSQLLVTDTPWLIALDDKKKSSSFFQHRASAKKVLMMSSFSLLSPSRNSSTCSRGSEVYFRPTSWSTTKNALASAFLASFPPASPYLFILVSRSAATSLEVLITDGGNPADSFLLSRFIFVNIRHIKMC